MTIMYLDPQGKYYEREQDHKIALVGTDCFPVYQFGLSLSLSLSLPLFVPACSLEDVLRAHFLGRKKDERLGRCSVSAPFTTFRFSL